MKFNFNSRKSQDDLSLNELLALYTIGAISPDIGDVFVGGKESSKKYVFTTDGFVPYERIGFDPYERMQDNKKRMHTFELRARDKYPILKEEPDTKEKTPEEYLKEAICRHQKNTWYGMPPRKYISDAEQKEYDDYTKMIDEIFKDKEKIKVLLNTLFDADNEKEKKKFPLMIINIEGIDAVGKASTSHALYDELTKLGLKVEHVSFPLYGGVYGQAIKEVLNGSCGDSSKLDPELIGPLYSLERIAYFRKYLNKIATTADVLICDRSFYSNFIYQASKLSSDELPDWIKKNYKYEFINTGLEKYISTMYTFVLTMDAESNKKQLATRDALDNNERNDAYLDKCREFINLMTDKGYYKSRLRHCSPEWGPYATANRISVQHVDPNNKLLLKRSIMDTVHTIIAKLYPMLEDKIKNNK